MSISLVQLVTSDTLSRFILEHGEHAMADLLLRGYGEVVKGSQELRTARVGALHLLIAALHSLEHIFLSLLLAFLLLLYTVRRSLIVFALRHGHSPDLSLAWTAFIISLIFRRASIF
jgi:hypothetical protein